MKAIGARAVRRVLRSARGCCAGALAALVVTGCAAPAPGSDGATATRREINAQKQSELDQMEAIGQRNNDKVPIRQ
jgi:hypothetical protein